MIEQTSLSDGFNSKTTYKYDAQNRLIESSEWSESIPYVTTYDYEGKPDNLTITTVVGGDMSSKTIYYFKNGLLDNYNQMGVLQRQDVKYDSHGNWMSFYNLVQGVNEQRFVDYY